VEVDFDGDGVADGYVFLSGSGLPASSVADPGSVSGPLTTMTMPGHTLDHYGL
jgi:hypothetical protein